jgi:large subunit ribosomal protein L1
MDRNGIKAAIEQALKEKGQRKFVQAIDLAINFRNVDFNKQDNRLNLDIILPKGKGKEQKVCVFADGQIAFDAQAAGVEKIIAGDQIAKIAADPALTKELLDYELLAAPNLMSQIGKSLGQVLGTKGKLPKPIMGATVKDLSERARKTVKIKSKGKFLPVCHVFIGTEKMSADDLTDNCEEVIDRVKTKVGAPNIKNIFVKLTMGKPIYIGEKAGAKPEEAG